MPRLVPSSSSSSTVREQIVEKLRERRAHHPLWPEYTSHYDADIERWESGKAMDIQAWQLPRAFRVGRRLHDRLIVEGDGTIRPHPKANRSE